jgi:hypothetical protein
MNEIDEELVGDMHKVKAEQKELLRGIKNHDPKWERKALAMDEKQIEKVAHSIAAKVEKFAI